LLIRPCWAGWPPDCRTRGFQAQVADQPLRGGEPTEVTDRGDDRQRHGRVHAGDGHQPADLGAFQADPAELGVDDAKLLGVEVQLAQQCPDCLVLAWGRSWVASQARPLRPNRSAAGQRGMRLRREDRLHLVPAAGSAAERRAHGG
jgi:hypothetical protein